MTKSTKNEKDSLKKEQEDEVILLEDLQPKQDVRGGAAKFLFGETKDKAKKNK